METAHLPGIDTPMSTLVLGTMTFGDTADRADPPARPPPLLTRRR